jgi:asparagine synthase (glutamine-hydrolysing)
MSVFRYIALIWRPDQPDQAACVGTLGARIGCDRIQWQCVTCREGLRVFHTGAREGSDRCHVLNAGTGIILGTLFNRGCADSVEPGRGVSAALASMDFDAVAASGGRWLVESCWGRYVAIFQHAPDQSERILRDPSGTLPCLMVAFQNVTLVFSHPEDLIRLHVLRPQPDWRYIALHAAFPQVNGRKTALQGVNEVCAGECISLQEGRRSHTFLWHPREFAHRAARSEWDSPSDCAPRVHATVRSCVQAWASQHRSLLHSLSGGLDSSLVLACLMSSREPPQVTAVNYYSENARGDERRYARAAATQARIKLLEYPIKSDVDLSAILNVRLGARPGFYLTSLQFSELECRMAAEYGATALFTGGWGDQLFYRSRNDYPALDYVRRHGFSAETLVILRDSAAMTGTTWWRVFRRALRNRARQPALMSMLVRLAADSLVHPEVSQSIKNSEELIHPWFRDTSRVPIGKLWHLFLLSGPVDLQRPFADEHTAGPDLVAPLRSQPLMEACLEIPTYVLTAGGADRPVPRLAFQHEIPAIITRRLSKGLIDESFQGVFRHNRSFVRELLLDGLLVKERILDAVRLERALSDEESSFGQPHPELLSHVCTEAWLQRSRALQQTCNTH